MNQHHLIEHSRKWDRTGVVVAAICLVHCLAFPLLVLLIPTTETLLNNPIVEATLLVSAILVGSISFFTSYQTHKKVGPLILGTLGVGLMVLSLFSDLEHGHSDFDSLVDRLNLLMMLGGALLITGHLWNIYACHCFCDTGCKHEEHHHH